MLNASSILFYQGKATTISILTDIGCVFCVTKGFQPSAVYREQAEKQLEAFEKYHVQGIIWDLREAQVIASEDQNWTINYWLPKALALGYRRGAIVIPENIFGEMSVRKTISRIQLEDQNTEADLAVQYFKDVPSAYEWMKAEISELKAGLTKQ
ncbi:MAG: hypothetical protein RMJ44_00160 [Cytophagales bacterium]|nr:hypothetical protein [Cytophagales bacterium]